MPPTLQGEPHENGMEQVGRLLGITPPQGRLGGNSVSLGDVMLISLCSFLQSGPVATQSAGVGSRLIRTPAQTSSVVPSPPFSMFFKRRWFKILLVVLGLLAFIGYFAFSTFLFPPHEDDWEFDVAGLVPRNVDFFMAKAGLADDFADFPRLAVADRVESSDAWRELESSPAYDAWLDDTGIEESLAQLRASVDQIPFGASPVDVFGGVDLAVAGNFQGTRLSQATWAVYGRMNWMGKAALGALNYPGLLGLDNAGLSVVEEDGVLHLSGAQLAQDLWVARVLDIGVVGNDVALVRSAIDLERASGEGSLYLSGDYGDNIELVQSRSVAGNEVEIMLDVAALLKTLGHTGPLPDSSSEQFLTAFGGRIFQVPACRKVMGVIGFDEGVSLDLQGSFSTEQINQTQRRIYGRDGFSHEEVLQKHAIIAPEDAVLFAYLEGPIATLLEEMLACAEPALRSNLSDAFRSTGRFTDIQDVVRHLGTSLHNRLALVLRPNDYQVEESVDPQTGLRQYNGPPNDGKPVFAVALITWYSNEAQVVALRDLIGNSPAQFGLQGRNGESGYYVHSIGSYETREFWSRFVPGTGVIATMNTHDQFIISNVHEMLRQIYKTTTLGGKDYPRLSERPEFIELLSDTTPSANLLVWMDPQGARETLLAQAQGWARENAGLGIDWAQQRKLEEAKLFPQLFPGKRRGQLTRDERDRLNAAIDPILAQHRKQVIQERIPHIIREKERQVAYAMGCSAFLAALRLEPRSFSLSVRAVTPLD